MKVAVIGYGHWGKNLARNFYELGALSIVCDSHAENVQKAKELYPGVEVCSSIKEVIVDENTDALVIATPSSTHYELAKEALLQGKHVYVEKPLALIHSEAEELHAIAQERDLILMVGHLLLYHPAVNKLKELVAKGDLGEIQHMNSDRRNFNRREGRDDNVMWDLAPHDFSMMSYILDADPDEVLGARGWSSSNDGVIDVVHVDLIFPNNVAAHIHNSWIDPQKQALLTVNGSKKTAVLNDTFKENKLEIYQRNSDGSITVEKPIYSNDEPLRLECKHFLDCIKHKITPTSDGVNGSQVVSILEKAENLMIKTARKIKELV